MRQPDARATAIAAAAVRLWTRLYTSGLPVDVRNARRAEIESDLWEFVHDPDGDDGLHRPVHILLRLMRGVADDLRWRLTLDRVTAAAVRVGAALTAALLVFIAWWVLDLMRTRVLPLPPDPPSVGVLQTPLDGRIDLAVHGDASR
jgi:hypothetical protein